MEDAEEEIKQKRRRSNNKSEGDFSSNLSCSSAVPLTLTTLVTVHIVLILHFFSGSILDLSCVLVLCVVYGVC